MLTAIQITLLIFTVLFSLMGMGEKDERKRLIMFGAAVVDTLLLLGSIGLTR